MRRVAWILGLACGCAPRAASAPAPRGSAPDRQSPPAAVIAAPAAPAPLAVGDRVICNWRDGGVYYPGRVAGADASGLAIQYDDGDQEQTDAAHCLREPPRARARPQSDAIAGEYRVEGENPNGTRYAGSIAITRDHDTYHLGWTIAGSAGYVGVGLHVENVLGVGWSTGSVPGVVVYRVDGGTLHGVWTAGNDDRTGTEDLDGPPGLSGTYRITHGANPDGSAYTGSVTITPRGDVYELAWSIPGTHYLGLGVLTGHVLSVGWSSGTAPGVVAYAVSPGTLDGIWATPGESKLGAEKLER